MTRPAPEHLRRRISRGLHGLFRHRLPGRVRWPSLVCTGLCLLIVAIPCWRASAAQHAEEDVKAAYLFNFTRFVTWPSAAVPDEAPFRVCVVADAQMTEVIERTMQGELVNGRPVATVVPKDVEGARGCQVLFVGRSSGERGGGMLAAVRDLPVLTVGESPDFVQKGGAIQFVMDRTRVRFDINPASAERVGLTISARLLKVARKTDVVRR